jgi:hypothetical protein
MPPPALSPNVSPAPAPAGGYAGEAVYFFAFDIAYEMRREPIRVLLGQPVAEFALDTNKRAPRQHTFYHPHTVRLPDGDRMGPLGPVRLERTVKILPVGAVSITIRVPFAVRSLDELTHFHDLRFADGAFLREEVRALAEDVRKELEPFLIRPLDELREEEAYTAFCLHTPATDPAFCCQRWLSEHRREVAALLTEEPDHGRLSDQEVEESTGKWLSYYERDLVVIDWDAALIIDEPRYFDESLYLIEMANIQLAELEAYDRLLDGAVERSYRDITAKKWSSLKSVSIPHDLREVRIDLARLSDELLNTTKFVGDWHMARIYQALSDRFHLGEWHRTIDDKLKTLDDLYQLLRSEQNNRWMLILEASIVVLFIIDLIVLFMGLD